MFGRLAAALISAAAFIIALGCGADGDAAERQDAAPSSAARTAEQPAPVIPTGEVGFELGDRIPEFEISLTSGASLSSAQLRASERPTFLFFFSMT